MSGFPGLEFFGPYEQIDAVRDTILEAGAEFGIRQVGGRAYASVATESGWIANTVPAVYTGDSLKTYREWSNGRSFEATLSLGGSFVGDRIEDYYATPWDLGYGHLLKFDHDFIGRAALERRQSEPHRRKTWLMWHRDDVAKVFASMYEPGGKRFKYIEMPAAFYAASHFDRVRQGDRTVGISTICSYTSNVRGWLSVAMLDETLPYGSEVELVWGEPDGGSNKPNVERHTQTTIRATVAERPFPAEKR
jgi:vanillate/3-O-methylgallate O-demethylase